MSDRSDTAGLTSRSPAISVLIPAQRGTRHRACVESVLKSRGRNRSDRSRRSLDRPHGGDRSRIAARLRVRVERAPPLPDGWCGKQHACFVLSKLAKHDVFTFLDCRRAISFRAARMKLFMEQSGAASSADSRGRKRIRFSNVYSFRSSTGSCSVFCRYGPCGDSGGRPSAPAAASGS